MLSPIPPAENDQETKVSFDERKKNLRQEGREEKRERG